MEFRNEKYTESGAIDCEISHPEFGWIPFTADPSDVEELGRELFAKIQGSGNPSAWVAPADITGAQAIEEVRARRDRLLVAEVDPIVTNPLRWGDLTTEKQVQWAAYRTALLSITDDYPDVCMSYAGNDQWNDHNIVWPIKPQEV